MIPVDSSWFIEVVVFQMINFIDIYWDFLVEISLHKISDTEIEFSFQRLKH